MQVTKKELDECGISQIIVASVGLEVCSRKILSANDNSNCTLHSFIDNVKTKNLVFLPKNTLSVICILCIKQLYAARIQNTKYNPFSPDH